MNKRNVLSILCIAAFVVAVVYLWAYHVDQSLTSVDLAQHVKPDDRNISETGLNSSSTTQQINNKNATDVSETIIGIDLNNDRVRDDVEFYINKTYSDPRSQSALKQFARAQASLLSVGNTVQGAHDATDELIKSLACVRQTLGPTYVVATKETLAKIINTKQRFAAYAMVSNNQAGQVFLQYKGDHACD